MARAVVGKARAARGPSATIASARGGADFLGSVREGREARLRRRAMEAPSLAPVAGGIVLA
eukprot:838297-Lingulodinium_polyedra.AAC.1